MSTTSERPESQHSPHRPTTGKRGPSAAEADVRRTRMELAETVSEVVTRANELPGRATKAVRRGIVHPATVASFAALLVVLLMVWRARHR